MNANLWSRNLEQKCIRTTDSPLLSSLVEWVFLALEIGEFHSKGNHQWYGYGSITRAQMITR